MSDYPRHVINTGTVGVDELTAFPLACVIKQIKAAPIGEDFEVLGTLIGTQTWHLPDERYRSDVLAHLTTILEERKRDAVCR